MKKDRLIQALAGVVSVGCVAGAATLVPSVNQQRLEHGLSYDLDFGDNVPPHVAMAVTAMGSFRGVAAAALWYRLEMLKREGQFYEADTTSRMITVLQPRFPKVWEFMAWNMAYNISVETHTPEERWDWVNKGIRLMREEAIPYNPSSVSLYKELGWLFFHKMGQRSDDMHRYYKYRFASEWDEVLGPMYEGRTPQQILDELLPVVAMAERYWAQNQPDLATRQALRVFIDEATMSDSEEDVELKKLVYDLEDQTPAQLIARLPELEQAIKARQAEWPDFDTDRFIEQVRERMTEQMARSQRGGERLFLEEFSGSLSFEALDTADQRFFQYFTPRDGGVPDIAPILALLDEYGIDLSRDGLRSVGRVIGVLQRLLSDTEVQLVIWREPDLDVKRTQLQAYGLEERDRLAFDAVMQIRFNDRPNELTGEVTGEPLFETFLRVVLPYWRAKVIAEDYKMNVTTMFLLMQTYGPIDWRMPSSHSLYWAHRGIQRVMQLMDKSRIDVINTQRMIIHSMQESYRNGTLTLNPFAENPTERIYETPNFAFVESYERAMRDSYEVYQHITGAKDAALEHFQSGHQNFLSDVVVRSYLYGDEAYAQAFLTRLRNEYGDLEDNKGRFRLALPDFVYAELNGDLITRNDSVRAATAVVIQRGFKEGLVGGDMERFAELLEQARQWHAAYNAEQADADANAGTRGRMVLPEWDQYVQNIFVQWMLSPAELPRVRLAGMFNTPPELLRAVWSRLRAPLRQQLPQYEIPDPPGWTPDAVETGGPASLDTTQRG